MNIQIAKNPKELGRAAAERTALLLREAIKEKGHARLLLSTGASQFQTISHLVKEKLDWSRVEMFHLDEYIGLSEKHKASFRGYLKKRFTTKLKLKAVHFVSGEGDVKAKMAALGREFSKSPIDVGLIGIGENSHIAFNDPPADFTVKKPFIIVNLDKRCKQQQVNEGWFETLAEVPSKAITMTPWAIMKCRHLISSVPHKAKATAIFNTLTKKLDPSIPATLLKTHPDWHLNLDLNSAAKAFPL